MTRLFLDTNIVVDLLDRREPFYSKARYTLDVSLMDSYDKVNISVAKLREILAI